MKEDKSRIYRFGIPYILTITVHDYTMWQIGFSIRILCFSFQLGHYYGVGWSCLPYLEKWAIRWPIHLGRILIVFTLELDMIMFYDFKIKIRRWKKRRGIK